MVLVLGRPGSGCSTFLKAIANQRAGYLSVDGTVEYAGVEATEFSKRYKGEIVYNQEDDNRERASVSTEGNRANKWSRLCDSDSRSDPNVCPEYKDPGQPTAWAIRKRLQEASAGALIAYAQHQTLVQIYSMHEQF